MTMTSTPPKKDRADWHEPMYKLRPARNKPTPAKRLANTQASTLARNPAAKITLKEEPWKQ